MSPQVGTLQVWLADRALIGLQDSALGEGGAAVDAGVECTDIFSPGAGLSLGMGLADVVRPVDALVSAPAGGHEGRPQLEHLVHGKAGVAGSEDPTPPARDSGVLWLRALHR